MYVSVSELFSTLACIRFRSRFFFGYGSYRIVMDIVDNTNLDGNHARRQKTAKTAKRDEERWRSRQVEGR